MLKSRGLPASTHDSQLTLWHGTKDRAWSTVGTHSGRQEDRSRKLEEGHICSYALIQEVECGNLILEFILFYEFLISIVFYTWKCNFSVKCISKYRFYTRQDLILPFDLSLTSLWRGKPSSRRHGLGLWALPLLLSLSSLPPPPMPP